MERIKFKIAYEWMKDEMNGGKGGTEMSNWDRSVVTLVPRLQCVTKNKYIEFK